MQLPLNIRLTDAYRFNNFFGGRNQELVDGLQTSISSLSSPASPPVESTYIWGRAGVGKTHLLQASCRMARELDIESVYLPLGEAGLEQPGILDDLHGLPLVCVDDIQVVAGQPEWEARLFRLYEGIKDNGMLLIASVAAPGDSGFAMPDLVSRFQRGLVYAVHSLDHQQRLQVLRQQAQLRGLAISDEVAAFIEKNFPRDLQSLVALLEQLDHQSLAQQRKITIPFIKSLLESRQLSSVRQP